MSHTTLLCPTCHSPVPRGTRRPTYAVVQRYTCRACDHMTLWDELIPHNVLRVGEGGGGGGGEGGGSGGGLRVLATLVESVADTVTITIIPGTFAKGPTDIPDMTEPFSSISHITIGTTVRATLAIPGTALPSMQLGWTVSATQVGPIVVFPAFDTTYTDLIVSGTLPLDPSGLPWTRAAINLLTVDIVCFANGGLLTNCAWNATTVTVYGT